MKTNKKYYDMLDVVQHAQRAEKYKELIQEALKKLEEYSQMRYSKEVMEFEKEVNECFEAYEQ